MTWQLHSEDVQDDADERFGHLNQVCHGQAACFAVAPQPPAHLLEKPAIYRQRSVYACERQMRKSAKMEQPRRLTAAFWLVTTAMQSICICTMQLQQHMIIAGVKLQDALGVPCALL